MLTQELIILDNSNLCLGWNFSPDPQDICTFRKLVQRYYTNSQSRSIELSTSVTENQEKPFFLKHSIEKAIHQFRLHPHWDLSATVNQMAQWYKGFYDSDKSDALNICHAKIDSYIAGSP